MKSIVPFKILRISRNPPFVLMPQKIAQKMFRYDNKSIATNNMNLK